MANVTMQSPWVTYSNKIREMFKRDPDIKMTWSDETRTLTMYVDNQLKADALSQILPSTKAWGKNVVTLRIIPANGDDFKAVRPAVIADAFEGNPIYHYTKTFKDAFLTNPVTYVVFAKEVLQWWNDDLNDIHGNTAALAEDLAYELFENTEGIFFCTDIE